MATRNSFFFYSLTVGFFLLSPMLADGSGPFELLEKMETSYASVNDYTAVFWKRERIRGKLRPEERIFFKFQKPFKFYMRWLQGAHEGREAVYVEGLNGNKVSVHEPQGLARFITALLDPAGARVLKESRFPFTEIGIGRIIERVGKDVRRGQVEGSLRLVDHGREKIQGREYRRMEGIIVEDAKETHSFSRLVLSIDEQLSLPIKVVLHDRADVIVGEYMYSDLRLNPGLQETDFDTSNPTYHFPFWAISY